MNALTQDSIVGVIGAGTMGAGIAQVAAAAGHEVVLFDVDAGAAQKALDSVHSGLQKLVERGRKSQQEVDDLCARIAPVESMQAMAGAALVIEVIIENLDIKRAVLSELEQICGSDTIIASNTSSISISALAAQLQHPARLVGMHFFNPAAILKLVEVISGLHTSPAVADTIFATAEAWGKTPVHARSTPGFIVNRIARPYYGEALRALTEQAASAATIDHIMRSCGGFRMGPFELMDLIGQDINLAVSESVYEAYYGDKRFQPSVLQAEMVAGGLLGRKSGRGYYDYTDDDKPAPEFVSTASATPTVTVYGELGNAAELIELFDQAGVEYGRKESPEGYILAGETRLQLTNGASASQTAHEQDHADLVLFDLARSYLNSDSVAIALAQQAGDQALDDASALFTALGKQVCEIRDVPGMLVMRTVSCLVNEAADAVNQGVCQPADVDTAMKLGVNYPEGPIEWGRRLGFNQVVKTLSNLQLAYGEERYRCSPWLQNRQYAE